MTSSEWWGLPHYGRLLETSARGETVLLETPSKYVLLREFGSTSIVRFEGIAKEIIYGRNGVKFSFDMSPVAKVTLALGLLSVLGSGESYNKERCPADDVRATVLKRVERLWADVSGREWQVAKRAKGTDSALVEEYKEIGDSIEETEKLIDPQLEDSVLSPLWPWAVVTTATHVIHGLYANFRRLQENPDPLLFSEAWTTLAEAVLHDSPTTMSTLNTLENLQLMITERVENHDNIFHLVSEETNSNICNIQQSPQQLLYNLYNALQLTQLKAYTMIQFSWMLLRLYNKGNFTLEADMMKRSYIEKMALQAEEIANAMKGAKREMWRCDPRRHIRDETFTELTKLVQGFIVNEVDLNTENTCREDCPFYKVTKQQGCYKDNYCNKQRPCRGKVINCKFVDSDMWVCPSDGSSKRRYDWIEYENGRTLGMKKSCNRAITKVDSWWRWLFWHCSYCMCLCDDQFTSGTDRFFNLRTTTSDMAKNRVITGLKFVKNNRVIHLQIQEGEMLPKGVINKTTVYWKPVEDYDIKTANEGEDYHMMSWEQRAIDLDDLKAPHGSVITAIRFRKLGGHINLEVQASKFNFTTGKLINAGEKSQWISNDNTDGSITKPRKKLVLETPDVPTRSVVQSNPDSTSDQFLEFTSSDMDSDAAQSTVPFIDIQPVSPKPPTPLSGVGIYHKGQRWFGGFIAPKVFTLDFTPYFEDSFPELNEMRQI